MDDPASDGKAAADRAAVVFDIGVLIKSGGGIDDTFVLGFTDAL
jgi:hypothetical protein